MQYEVPWKAGRKTNDATGIAQQYFWKTPMTPQKSWLPGFQDMLEFGLRLRELEEG